MNDGTPPMTEHAFRKASRGMARSIAAWEHAGRVMAKALGKVAYAISQQAEFEGEPTTIAEDADAAMGRLDRLQSDIRGLFE